MTKAQADENRTRWLLRHNGWEIQKRDAVEFNHGSETLRHATAKLLAAWCLRQKAYRVDTEVSHYSRGAIDVLGYAGTRIVAVELETSPTEEIIEDKLNRYVSGTPINEMFLINISEMPENILDAYEWIEDQL